MLRFIYTASAVLLMLTFLTRQLFVFPWSNEMIRVLPFRYGHGRTIGKNAISNLFSQSKISQNLMNRKFQRKAFTSFHSTMPWNTDSITLELEVDTIEDMQDVGAVLSIASGPGDVILLDGDLGAGKTCFSRGFIRSRTGFGDIRVTSPTYLLSNTYPADNGEVIIHHMDLYRLSEGKEEDLEPLNLDHVLLQCISLIEWPSRLGEKIPSERLDVTFRIDIDSSDSDDAHDDLEEVTRSLILKAHGEKWVKRIQQIISDGYLDDLIVEYEDER
mmetsp:Transcript_8305/g.9558  ORF Transcript_8305/g.9558 Transcript_8305/m.9558 type:complete len:273 (-) Transcript_8305:366-1184(-)